MKNEAEKYTAKLLDLSGYTYSGKSAYSDFFRNFHYFTVDDNEVEFDLVRIKNGLWDLKQALASENWSILRASEAINSFKRVAQNLSGSKKYSKITTPGAYLEMSYPGLQVASERLLDNLITHSIICDWPFTDYNLNKCEIFIRKLKRKLGFSLKDKVLYSRISKKLLTMKWIQL